MVVRLSETLYLGGVARSGVPSHFDRLVDEYDVDTLVSVTTYRTPETAVHIPLSDDGRNDPGEVRRAIDEVCIRTTRGERVLVYCTMGTSRSVAIAAGARALRTGEPVRDVIAEIDAEHDTQPHPVLVEQAEAAVDRLRNECADRA